MSNSKWNHYCWAHFCFLLQNVFVSSQLDWLVSRIIKINQLLLNFIKFIWNKFQFYDGNLNLFPFVFELAILGDCSLYIIILFFGFVVGIIKFRNITKIYIYPYTSYHRHGKSIRCHTSETHIILNHIFVFKEP